MWQFWSVNNIALTLMGYPLSYIELFGTLLYLWSVWLIAKRDTLTWPIGIASVLLYLALFYQIGLYSDVLEQVYYLVISVYGWWRWTRLQPDTDRVLAVRFSPPRQLQLTAVVTIVLSLTLGTLMSRIHLLVPAIFHQPASFPYLDAITTVMSFTAMGLITHKWLESWYYWIIVDVIGIGLYYAKEVKLIALLYAILLIMAINGLRSWYKAAKIRET